MKYWPLAVAVFGMIGFYFNNNSLNAAQDKSINKLEVQVAEQSKDYATINVAQVQLQSKVDSSYELIKDIKDSLKEIKNERRPQ